jgi:hypothetical protein
MYHEQEYTFYFLDCNYEFPDEFYLTNQKGICVHRLDQTIFKYTESKTWSWKHCSYIYCIKMNLFI